MSLVQLPVKSKKNKKTLKALLQKIAIPKELASKYSIQAPKQCGGKNSESDAWMFFRVEDNLVTVTMKAEKNRVLFDTQCPDLISGDGKENTLRFIDAVIRNCIGEPQESEPACRA